MASIATPLQVDEGLESSFKSAIEGGSIRFLQVQVKEERLVLATSQEDSGSVQSGFEAITSVAGEEEASYFIFKLKPKEWILITYVPEKVPIKEKMVYASAKGTLKDKFGHSLVVEELHATSRDELTFEHFQGTKAPADARSTLEIERERLTEEENDARNEIEQQQTAKREAQASGGYHSVTIPLAASAKTALDRLKSGEINFVGLSVDESQSSIVATDVKSVDTSRISSEIHTGEPRFYLFAQTGRTVFIYSCPTRSPPKLRMTYSTSKPNVVNQVTQYGINLAPKKVEITDPDDLADELKDAQTSRPVNTSFRGTFTGRMIAPAPGSTPALGGTVKASNLPTMSNQHSIYGLMARPGTEQPTTKKKIVIPPRAAWNG